VDEHALARLQVRLREQRVVRRDEDLGDGGGLLETEAGWNLGEMILRHDHVLGLRPARRDAEDALPRPPRPHLVARLIDLARELKPRNVGGRARRRGVVAAPLQQVCAVQPRGAHAHAHAVGQSPRPLDLAHLKRLHAPVRGDDHGTHPFVRHS
jgi:hypothetical protein